MLTLDLLKTIRISRTLKRAQLADLAGISPERLKALELRDAEPWFDETIMLHRALCTAGILPLISSDDLTLSALDSPLPTDLSTWRTGARAPLSLAVRVAIAFGLDDPCHLSVTALQRQMWDAMGSGERHPEAPGWCPWCAADIADGSEHLPTCLPNNLYAPHAVTSDEERAPLLKPKARVQRTKGIPAYGLRALREEREMLQKDVAALLGVHVNYYARIERAAVPLTVEMAGVLAGCYNVDRAVLYARPQA